MQILLDHFPADLNLGPTWQTFVKGGGALETSGETLRQFCEYRWPGNIRQLGNVIEQAYVLDCEPRLPERPHARKLAEAALPLMDLSQLRRSAVRHRRRIPEIPT